MKALRFLGILILCTVTVIHARAQTDLAPGAEPVVENLIDIDFPGGAVTQLVAALEKAAGHDLNILVAERYEQIAVPGFKLRQVSIAQVFEALNRLTLWTKHGIHWDRLPGERGARPGTPIWTVEAGPGSLLSQMPRVTQVFYVGDYLRQFKIEDLTTAIQTTWKVADMADGAELKYHEDTQLLIALVRQEQLQLMTDVLEKLKAAIKLEKAGPADGGGSSEPQAKRAK